MTSPSNLFIEKLILWEKADDIGNFVYMDEV